MGKHREDATPADKSGEMNSELDQFDALIRQEFAATFPTNGDTSEVLSNLSPKFRRAGQIELAKRAAVGVVGALAITAGMGFLMTRAATEADVNNTIASQPADTQIVSPVEDTTDQTRATSITGSEADETGKATTSDKALKPFATEPATTDSPEAGPFTTTLDSGCGSVVLAVTSDSIIEIVDVEPKSGMSSEVKSEGPNEIEISFEGRSSHCELKVKLIDGELVTEVEK